MQLGVLLSPTRLARLSGESEASLLLRALRHERNFGVTSIFMTPELASQAVLRRREIRGVIASPGGWRQHQITDPPRVYHNQLAVPGARQTRALRALNGSDQALVFNETNRWRRTMWHRMLEGLPATRKLSLPIEVCRCSPAVPGFYLLTAGRQQLRRAGFLLDVRSSGEVRYIAPAYGLVDHCRPEELLAIAQDALRSTRLHLSPLPGRPAGVRSGPCEWRFYVHRGPDGDWVNAASVAKVDAMRAQSRARAFPLTDALGQCFGERCAQSIAERLESQALAAARCLSLFLPGIAHLALDFWLDEQAQPFVVDISGWYQTHWLEQTGQSDAIERLLDHPACFARLVDSLGLGVSHINVDLGRPRP